MPIAAARPQVGHTVGFDRLAAESRKRKSRDQHLLAARIVWCL
jgi:hypothetical protein